MLSTIACRSGGAFVQKFKCQSIVAVVPKYWKTTSATPATGASTAVVPDAAAKQDLAEQLGPRLKNWKEAHDVFYGPDRDFKNFPTMRQLEDPPKMRMWFIPESYFKFMEPKTGVLGPYFLMFGGISFLLSKEIVPFCDDFVVACLFIPSLWYVAGLKDGAFAKWIDKRAEDFRKQKYSDPMDRLKNMTVQRMENCETEIWRQEGLTSLFEAKKENVHLQLESTYRKRLKQVYSDVKKRLDYQLDMESTKRRLEQEHMVNWIVDGVIKSITPQQEKDSIANCILNLKKLSSA